MNRIELTGMLLQQRQVIDPVQRRLVAKLFWHSLKHLHFHLHWRLNLIKAMWNEIDGEAASLLSKALHSCDVRLSICHHCTPIGSALRMGSQSGLCTMVWVEGSHRGQGTLNRSASTSQNLNQKSLAMSGELQSGEAKPY